MDNKKSKLNPRNKEMRAKLSFDEGFAEKPIYRIIAKITEIEKGIGMMDLIQKMFNISEWQRGKFVQKVTRELRFPPVREFVKLREKEKQEDKFK